MTDYIPYIIQTAITALSGAGGAYGAFKALQGKVERTEKDVQETKGQIEKVRDDLKECVTKDDFKELQADMKGQNKEFIPKDFCRSCQDAAGERRTNCKETIARMERTDQGLAEHLQELEKCLAKVRPECV